MIALYILAGLLLLLLLALLMPIRIYLQIQETITLKCRYLFFEYALLPKTFSEKAEKPKAEDEPSPVKKLINDKGLHGAIQEIIEILKNVLTPLRILFQKITFLNLDLQITVADTDAALTAIEYGAVCSVVYPLVAAIESLCGIKKRQLQVQSDFEGGQPKLACFASAQIRPIFILSFLYTFLKSYIKQKLKDGAQNGRK